MRSMQWRSLAAFLAMAAAAAIGGQSACAQGDPTLAKIIDIGRNDNRVMEHMDYLTNHIGPRLTGSHSLIEAGEWAVSMFESWGYEAALDVAGEVSVRFERGPWQGKMVEPEEMAFEFGTASFTAGTKGKERAPAVMGPSTPEELETMKDTLAGAWVLIPAATAGGRGGARGQRGQRGQQRGQRGARRGQRRGQRGQRRSRRGPNLRNLILEAGARGTITRATNPISLLGRPPSSYEDRATNPDIRLVGIYYDRVRERLDNGEDVVLEFDIRNYMTPGPATFTNVIAMMRGTEFPDEYVVFGGHFDSYDSATGTIDNGDGSMTAFEAARILAAAGVRPRRTIVFALWGGEEFGLLGSRSWIERNPDMHGKISGYFNQDSGTNAIMGTSGTPGMMDQLHKALDPINLINSDFPFEISERESFGSGGSSDHASFNRAGIPGFGWSLRGDANYGITWHTNWDTYERLFPEYMKHSAAAIAVAAYGLANLDKLLVREPR